MTTSNALVRAAAALCLALTASPGTAAGPDDAVDLRRLIAAHYYAVGENRLEEAMSFYHEDSPQGDEVRRELARGRSAYLQRTSILDFELICHEGERAIVSATHHHLRIAGVKFMEEIAETRYVLLRQGAEWRIWSRASPASGR